MRIGEVARQTGISVRAVRHYESLGLLSAQRADNRYRIFTPQDLERIRLIRLFLSVGFQLEEIRKYGPCWQQNHTAGAAVPPTEMKEFFERKLALLDDQIATLQKLRQGLHDKLQGLPGQD